MKLFFHKYAFENIVCGMPAILSMGRYGNCQVFRCPSLSQLDNSVLLTVLVNVFSITGVIGIVDGAHCFVRRELMNKKHK